MTKIFIFAHFGLNMHHSFFIFCYLERICLYNREIILAVLHDKHQHDKESWYSPEIVIFKRNITIWYDIFAISPTPNSEIYIPA